MTWADLIMPYVKNTQLFICPSDSAASCNWSCTGLKQSYMANYTIGNGWGPSTALAKCVAPASTVYVCDGGAQATVNGLVSPVVAKEGCWILQDPGPTAVGCPGCALTTDWNWGGPNPRHSEVANVGFVDGHVKAMKSTWYYGGTPWMNPAVGGS